MVESQNQDSELRVPERLRIEDAAALGLVTWRQLPPHVQRARPRPLARIRRIYGHHTCNGTTFGIYDPALLDVRGPAPKAVCSMASAIRVVSWAAHNAKLPGRGKQLFRIKSAALARFGREIGRGEVNGRPVAVVEVDGATFHAPLTRATPREIVHPPLMKSAWPRRYPWPLAVALRTLRTAGVNTRIIAVHCPHCGQRWRFDEQGAASRLCPPCYAEIRDEEIAPLSGDEFGEIEDAEW